MAIRQTRVFVHRTEGGADWAESVIGRVFRQLIEEFDMRLRWFWFSRYVCQIGEPGEDRGDCDLDAIPEEYKGHFPGSNGPGHRSLRFRFEIMDDDRPAFEIRLQQLLGQYAYAFSDIRDYDHVGDAGGHRFLGMEHRRAGGDLRRGRLVTHLFHALSQLVIDGLVGPDAGGRYRMEENDDQENPNGSTFESLHHLFCNITRVPVSIIVSTDAQPKLLGTFWGPPSCPQPGQYKNQTLAQMFLQY